MELDIGQKPFEQTGTFSHAFAPQYQTLAQKQYLTSTGTIYHFIIHWYTDLLKKVEPTIS